MFSQFSISFAGSLPHSPDQIQSNLVFYPSITLISCYFTSFKFIPLLFLDEKSHIQLDMTFPCLVKSFLPFQGSIISTPHQNPSPSLSLLICISPPPFAIEKKRRTLLLLHQIRNSPQPTTQDLIFKPPSSSTHLQGKCSWP